MDWISQVNRENTCDDLPPKPLNLPIPTQSEPLKWNSATTMSSSEIPVEGIKSLEDNIDNEGNDAFVFQKNIVHEIKDGNLYF